MSLSTLRPRSALLPSGPVSEPTSIRNLMNDFSGEVNLRPVYQREIKWNKENMCDLVKTVMNQGLIPGIILYKLQADERTEDCPFRYEMVDGQHRFFTIQKYFKSEPVTEVGSKQFMITWVYRDETSKKDIHIFYKKNSHTEQWESENRHANVSYMTEDEKDAFNSFKIDTKTIKDRLTLDQRRNIFISLQRGVAVRGSDLYKNMTNIRLVRFITEEMALEAQMKRILQERCWMNPKNYWLHWVIRFYLIRNPTSDKSFEEQFGTRDSEISKLIKDESSKLYTTEESEKELQSSVQRFFTFLDTLPKSVKFSPCHFYAIFNHLANAEEEREDIIRSHVDTWANNAKTKSWKTAWENRKKGPVDEERIKYFLDLCHRLDQIRVPAPAPEARKSLPKKIRKQVWKKYFQDLSNEGKCYCCEEPIKFDDDYEAGHIIAHALGGSDTVDNLRPVCQCCNRSMYMQNMDEYKAQYYSNQ